MEQLGNVVQHSGGPHKVDKLLMYKLYTNTESFTLQSLNAAVADANAEKVAAQQALHEAELKMREMASRRLSPRELSGPESSNVQKKILTMEDKTVGEQCRATPQAGTPLMSGFC